MRGAKFNNIAFTGAVIRDACLGKVDIAECGYEGATIDGILVTELLRVYRENQSE